MNDAPALLDPELGRVTDLLVRERVKEASDAEREELAMYRREQPELVAEAEAEAERRVLGRGFLERVEADQRVQAVDTGKAARVERSVGGLLALAGFGGSFALPVIGTAVMLTGFGILAWSVLRVRLQTLRDDPYRNLKE